MMDDGTTPLSSRRADPHVEREPGDPHPPLCPNLFPVHFPRSRLPRPNSGPSPAFAFEFTG